MAPLAKQVSVLMFLMLISSLQIEARLGKIFTTITAFNYAPDPEPQVPTLAPSISPAAAPLPTEGGFGFTPALAPSDGEIGFGPAPVESDDNPYGLYSGYPTEFYPEKTTKTTTTTATPVGNEKDEILGNEIASERLGENNDGSQFYYSNNNHYGNDNYYNNKAYSNPGYSYSNNGYENNAQKGMSDTRFLQNGEYYDVNNEKMNNGYEAAAKENRYNTEGYYGYGETSNYEFDSMEEYERQQGYPDTERLYNP